MPREGGLPVEEPCPHGIVRGVGIVFFDGDRQSEIGGPESDPDEVEEFRWFAVRRRRVTAVVAGSVGHWSLFRALGPQPRMDRSHKKIAQAILGLVSLPIIEVGWGGCAAPLPARSGPP